VVCDDPMHREQIGFGRPGAKGLADRSKACVIEI
jgi:hypothetical protein